MGGLMLFLWGIRFFAFKLHESPKYLMGRGRDEKAVEVVHKVAEFNGTTSNLTLEHLQSAGSFVSQAEPILDTSATAAVQRKLAKFDSNHVKSLFATRKLAYSTSLLIMLWGMFVTLNPPVRRSFALSSTSPAFIGLAFPLYNSFVTYLCVPSTNSVLLV
jgi:hypothetical protein